MMVNAPCKLCERKRARRHCPALGSDICPTCCGAERENSIDCPASCEFLQEARLRERPEPLPEDQVPNQDIRVTEEFLRSHDDLVVFLSTALARAIEAERAVDQDAREALAAIIRTYRTRESGLIYETRPSNPYAAKLQDALTLAIEELHKSLAESSGMQSLRDTDILGVLVFLQRIELPYQNNRRRGRAFSHFLSQSFPAQPATAIDVPLADAPLIEL